MTHDSLRTRLKEDAQRLRASGSHTYREVAMRIDAILDATDELTLERDAARKSAVEAAALVEIERVLRCAFCGTEYPPGTPPTQHEALTAHVKVCVKHPMRQVEAALEMCIAHLEAQSDPRARLLRRETVIDLCRRTLSAKQGTA